MPKKYSYRPDLQIASIISDEGYQHLAVHTLLQNPGKKQPAITAYLGARYSRSADPMDKIAAEAYEGGVDAAKRLELIFSNYGHKSVGDMADLFVCIENIPMLLAQKLFNQIPVVSGQERSTRYQNFANPDYIHLPEDLDIPENIREDYEKLIAKAYKDYADLSPITKTELARVFKIDMQDKALAKVLEARAFDTVRYLLPVGACTSLGILTSARVWSDTIAFFRASPARIDRELAELLFELLKGPQELRDTGYVPEAEGLIRHSEANPRSYDSADALLQLLTAWEVTTSKRKFAPLATDAFTVELKVDALQALLRNYLLLRDPISKDVLVKLSPSRWQELGKAIFKEHNHHNQLRTVGQQGAIVIEGMADLGVLKDLNRHRSLERIVPLWNENSNIDRELERPLAKMYHLCNYLELPALKELRAEYASRLNATYKGIKKWLQDTKGVLPAALRSEYVKYLLPHAHATTYRFYGSVDDLQYTIHLRSRNGGHIAYRALSYAWAEELARKNPFWKGVLSNIPKVEAGSREQFIDRS